MKKFLAVFVLVAIAAVQSPAYILVASDNSSNAAYTPSWDNGDNGGYGYTPWSLKTSNTAGHFQASATNNDAGGPPTSDDINVGGDSFGLFADNPPADGISAAFRGFDFDGNSTLDSLGTMWRFHWEMDNGGVDDPGSSVGLSLRTGNANSSVGDIFTGRRFAFEFLQGSANYTIVDGSGVVNTGISWRRTGLGFDFTLTSPDTYSLVVSNINGGAILGTFTGTLAGTAGAPLQSFSIYNRFAGAGSDRDLFFNSFDVYAIPEPSTILLLVGGAGLVFYNRRKLFRR